MRCREILGTTPLLVACLHVNPTHAARCDVSCEREHFSTHADGVDASSWRDATSASRQRAAAGNLVVNGGFSEQPNPLAFWTNAPGAFVTWVSEGANGSQGSVHLRFLPPISTGVASRGAVYYTGLTQCVSIPRPGRYQLRAFARVPEVDSPSSVAGLAWTLRFNASNCAGASDSNWQVNFSRSTAWTASSIASIEIDPADWTATTTIEIAVQVGDSSTASIEPVEAVVDEIFLIEGPLFADGFEE